MLQGYIHTDHSTLPKSSLSILIFVSMYKQKTISRVYVELTFVLLDGFADPIETFSAIAISGEVFIGCAADFWMERQRDRLSVIDETSWESRIFCETLSDTHTIVDYRHLQMSIFVEHHADITISHT